PSHASKVEVQSEEPWLVIRRLVLNVKTPEDLLASAHKMLYYGDRFVSLSDLDDVYGREYESGQRVLRSLKYSMETLKKGMDRYKAVSTHSQEVVQHILCLAVWARGIDANRLKGGHVVYMAWDYIHDAGMQD
ncbi:hypothetical protein KIPB_010315, partial [Kipferlia bialata]